MSRYRTPRAKTITQHDYRLADGYLVCARYRYEKIHPKIPKGLTFTPASNGGWWVAAPHKDTIPPEDRYVGMLPLYRLPELLRAIEGNDRPIWIVEGEDCVDAVLNVQDAPKGGLPPVTCLLGDLDDRPTLHDFSPLLKRQVLLIADPDPRSHKKMSRLARILHTHHDCRIKHCLPPETDGRTIKKAVQRHGGYPDPWGYSAAVKWLEKHGIDPYHADLGSKPLETLFTRQLPFATAKQGEFSLIEALRVCKAPDSRKDSWARACDDFLRRHGVIWRARESVVLLAHALKELRRVLDGTEYRTVDLSRYLKELPGARKPRSRPRLMGGHQPSYVAFTPSQLRRLGLVI